MLIQVLVVVVVLLIKISILTCNGNLMILSSILLAFGNLSCAMGGARNLLKISVSKVHATCLLTWLNFCYAPFLQKFLRGLKVHAADVSSFGATTACHLFY